MNVAAVPSAWTPHWCLFGHLKKMKIKKKRKKTLVLDLAVATKPKLLLLELNLRETRGDRELGSEGWWTEPEIHCLYSLWSWNSFPSKLLLSNFWGERGKLGRELSSNWGILVSRIGRFLFSSCAGFRLRYRACGIPTEDENYVPDIGPIWGMAGIGPFIWSDWNLGARAKAHVIMWPCKIFL